MNTRNICYIILTFAGLCHATGNEPLTLRRSVDRVPSLDPIHAESVGAARAVGLVYETLLEYDYAARPYALRGCVAASLPEVSEDGRVLTFRLRDDVFFGPDRCFGDENATRKLTAHDVAYSFKRLADAKLSSPGYWTIEKSVAGAAAFRNASREENATDYSREISGIRVLDDRTLQIELVEPSSEFLWKLAMSYTAIVPREAVEMYGRDFASVEVGSGAYRLKSWTRNYRMTFERRPGRDIARDATPALPGYDGTGEPIHTIEYLVIDDPSTRWLAFLGNMLDLNGEISRDNWDAVIDADGALSADLATRGICLETKPSLDTYYIAFNMDDPVVGANKKLRQAMSCAFDSAQWVSINRGRILAADGPVPPGIDGRDDTPFAYAFDLDKAKKLVAEAGYPSGTDPGTGRRLTLTLDLGRTDQETRESAELFASFMDSIGIVVNLQYNNWPSFLRKVGRREAQLFMVGWIADYPDILNFLQLFVSRNASPGPNRCNYNNPEYDALYDIAAQSGSALKMQRMIREDVPWIFMHHRRDNMLLHPNIKNHKMHDFPYGMEKHWRMVK